MISFNRILFYALVLGVCASSTRSFWVNASILEPAGKWNSVKQPSNKLLQTEDLQQKYFQKLQVQNSNRNRTQTSQQREQFWDVPVTAPNKTQLTDHPSIYPSDWDHFDESLLNFASQISDANSSLGRCCFEKPVEEKHICLDQDSINYKSIIDYPNPTDWQRIVISSELFRSTFCMLIPKFLQTQCLESPERRLNKDIKYITMFHPHEELFNSIKRTLKSRMKHCHELESYEYGAFGKWVTGFGDPDYMVKAQSFFRMYEERSTSKCSS